MWEVLSDFSKLVFGEGLVLSEFVFGEVLVLSECFGTRSNVCTYGICKTKAWFAPPKRENRFSLEGVSFMAAV